MRTARSRTASCRAFRCVTTVSYTHLDVYKRQEQLRKVDEVAYVRFASVYRQFKDINTFMEELNTLCLLYTSRCV